MAPDTDETLRLLEERMAHLIRTMDELSDVIAQQDKEIRRLREVVAYLSARDAESQSAQGVIIGDERPPHY